MAGYRQEVLNVVLAQVLHERGIVSVPEGIIQALHQRRRIPDVLVDFYGLRTMIEGEVGDSPGANERALASALKRVEEGLAHIGIAIIYPASLRRAEFSQLPRLISECLLEIAVVSEAWPQGSGFSQGDISHVADILQQAFDQLVKEDVVAQAVAVLDACIEDFAALARHSPGFIPQAGRILEMRPLPAKKKISPEEEME